MKEKLVSSDLMSSRNGKYLVLINIKDYFLHLSSLIKIYVNVGSKTYNIV